MNLQVLTYPFLFIALYFESFLLVTFLSGPARASRGKMIKPFAMEVPRVAIVVPCWNEETTIAGTVESLLELEYPKKKLSIILVDDGSTDGTSLVIDRFSHHSQITALHKENGGKFTAMNLGIEYAKDAEIIGFLDADSFVAPDALREIVAAFNDKHISAVTASMSIHKPRTILQRMQYAEYSLAITLRHVFASINGLYVTPGPFSFYRRFIFANIGLFKHAYLAEDMEMAMRMQRAGLHIGNAIRARVYTKGPPTFAKLIKQRVRWTTGFMRNMFFDYRDLLGVKKNAVLGILVLPLGIIAIVSGIFLFLLSIFQVIRHVIHAFSMTQAAPLSYMLSWHSSFTWFYLPITVLTLLGVMIVAGTFGWMIVGKRMSRTPGKLMFSMVLYLLLYGIIAPLWLMRSVSDVTLGVRTTWR
ncbi:MAG: glycosyltransferase [Candidatus Kaiserbacteria bacterium]|nr:glycosyltransferase [Candidatus Kaiserbacteria bacterium]